MTLTHTKIIHTLWFEALWNGYAMCAFMRDDEPHQEIRASDVIIMQDSHDNRRMKGIISHIYNGIDFVDPEMICVSFTCIAKLFDKEGLSPTNDSATVGDCYICHHVYPGLAICSRCGPQCAACQQACDKESPVDIIDNFLTRFAAGAGTLFEWTQKHDGALRAKIGNKGEREMCPITAQYAIEYGPCWDAQAAGAAALALKLPKTARNWIINAADNENMQHLEVRKIRSRLARIAGHPFFKTN